MNMFTLEEAVDKLKETLVRIFATVGDRFSKEQITIGITNFSGFGPRIYEIGYMVNNLNGTGYGSSWMRSDIESRSAILSAEDFLITYGDEPEWEGDDLIFDNHGEAIWNLAYAILGDDMPPEDKWDSLDYRKDEEFSDSLG